MVATPQTFTWPVKTRAVAFIQVGDVVEVFLQNRASAFAACEFCRSANHRFAGRCRICGGALPVLGDEERSERVPPRTWDVAIISDTRALVNALFLALMLALLLFGGFELWHLLRP